MQSTDAKGAVAGNYDEISSKSNDDSTMQAVESFLDSIIPSTSLLADDGDDAFVKSPSEMYASDQMDVDVVEGDDDLLRRRESQIWEGAFDNSPRTSRKRKRAERRREEEEEEEAPDFERSTESPSTDTIPSEDDHETFIPGALAFSFGPSSPTILTLTFDIDDEQAAAAERWTSRTAYTEISWVLKTVCPSDG